MEYPGDIKTQQTDSTRLRISLGTAGQLLKVNTNGLPYWEDFEVVQKVYYVAPEGNDTINNGSKLSAPFKTVK